MSKEVPRPSGRTAARLPAQEQGNAVQNHAVFVSNFADYLRRIAPEAN